MHLAFERPTREAFVIAPQGTLDETNADIMVREAFDAMRLGVTRIAVDCSDLRYVSSYALGALVRIHKRLAEQGQALALACVSDRLFTLLHLVRLSEVFPRFPTVDAALDLPTT